MRKLMLYALLLTSLVTTVYARERLTYSNPMDLLTFNTDEGSVEPTDIDQLSFLNVYDPIEPVNRLFYEFNIRLDHHFLVPVTEIYRKIFPDFARRGVANFFQNLSDVSNTLNGLAQFRPIAALRSGARLLLNTTLGIGGLFDPASAMGITYQTNNLAITLGYYGFRAGPFLMLPVLGPSSLRDAIGQGGDILTANKVDWLTIPDHIYSTTELLALYGINDRSELQISYDDFASPFSYDLIRFLYTRKLEIQIDQIK